MSPQSSPWWSESGEAFTGASPILPRPGTPGEQESAAVPSETLAGVEDPDADHLPAATQHRSDPHSTSTPSVSAPSSPAQNPGAQDSPHDLDSNTTATAHDPGPAGATGTKEQPDDEPHGFNPELLAEGLDLLNSLADWAKRSGITDRIDAALTDAAATVMSMSMSKESTPFSADSPQGAPDDPSALATCEHCPICRGMALVEQAQPHVVAGVQEVLGLVNVVVDQALSSFNQQSHPDK